MNFKYHIQLYAIQRYNTILPLPDDVKIDEKYLAYLDEDEFRFALSEIHEIFKGFYKGMADDPDDYGIVACDLGDEFHKRKEKLDIDHEYGRLKSDDYYEEGRKKTIQHFYKLQKALNPIFLSVNGDMTRLSIEKTKLEKFKIRKLPDVVKRLEEQGFEITENDGYFNFTHENKNIFKIFALCGLSCLAWVNIAADKKIKDVCMDFLTAAIFENEDKEFLKTLQEFLLSKGFIYKIKDLSDNIRYTRKGKLEFASFGLHMRIGFAVKIRLANLDKYIDALDTVTENVRENILQAYFCRGCAPCKTKSYRFSYKDKKYVKCCRGCYHFYNLTLGDWESIKLLMENELKYY